MLILLDIDGVMVPAKSWSAPPVLEDGFSVFKHNSVVALNKIISKSNAKIILTTSHKYRFPIKTWVNLFRNRGININDIDRLPKNEGNFNRMTEITNWYSSNEKNQEFVILDDDKSLNALPNILKSRLILTQPLIGLNNSHVKDSLNILNSPLELA